MAQIVENLNKKNLRKAYKRLKKDSRNFTALIVRDPFDNLDFEVNIDSNLANLIFEVNASSYHPQRPYLHLSAKSKGINRPTVVFDVKDALVYRFCIEQIEDELIQVTRQKNIRGGVKISPNLEGNGEFYEKWFNDWMEHQKSLHIGLGTNDFLVTTDIASYYDNINLLVLKDSVRGVVQGKYGVLNLLFYFLESTRLRSNYEVNTYNGLPQEDNDCSRILAYFFLNPHDVRMKEFCREYHADYFRFVDDMSLIVYSEAIGKWALKNMAESLRKLNLVSSIEKTAIVKGNIARKVLFFVENDYLSQLEQELKWKIHQGKRTKRTVNKITNYYSKLLDNGKEEYKNWNKILKRFYTLLTYAESDFFLHILQTHIIQYPSLMAGNKILKYLLQNQGNKSFNKSIRSLIKYLYSIHNLYPSVESNIIELFVHMNTSSFNKLTIEKLKKLTDDFFFKEDGHRCLSDYSRALMTLLIYKIDANRINDVAKLYLKPKKKDYLLRKYMICVSLTVEQDSLHNKVLDKARKEQSISINRLINLIENIEEYRNSRIIKTYLKRDKVTILFDDKIGLEIVKQINPVRASILRKIMNR